LAERLMAGGNIERQALEALALSAYQTGQLTKPELRRMLGFGSRPALDGFLASHGLFGAYTQQDLDRDRQDLERLGL